MSVNRKTQTPSLSSLSLVFPAYNDARSLPIILRKTLILLPKITDRFEIIIVDDASNDNTFAVLKKMQKSIPHLKIIAHKKNQGYGGALITGFKAAKKKYIFYTDSDGQYDVTELLSLVIAMKKNVDIVTGFKKKRSDSVQRKIIGACYNQSVRLLFGLKIKDTDCDFRLFKRSLLRKLDLQTKSGAFDVEFMTKLQQNGARFKEIGVSHYPRKFGSSQFFNLPRIYSSLRDVLMLWITMRYKPIL